MADNSVENKSTASTSTAAGEETVAMELNEVAKDSTTPAGTDTLNAKAIPETVDVELGDLSKDNEEMANATGDPEKDLDIEGGVKHHVLLDGDPEAPTSAYTGWRLAVVMTSLFLGSLLGALDLSIVATALPAMAKDLNGSSEYVWIATAYFLTSTALQPTWGKISDIFGRRNVLLFAILEFTLASLMCGFSNSMIMLIVARALQGIGGGALIAVITIVVSEIVAPRDRAKYQGLLASTYIVSTILGPLMGGVFTDKISWRWAFFINVPVGAIAFIFIFFFLKMPHKSQGIRTQIGRIDFIGATIFIAGATALCLGLNWGGNQYPWSSAQVLVPLCLAVPILGAFGWWEVKMAKEPIIPPELFSSSNFNWANVDSFIFGYVAFASFYFLPLAFQTVNGDSATTSGLKLIPLAIFSLGTAISSGFIISKTGKYVILNQIGMTGSLLVSLFAIMNQTTPYWAIALIMLPVGISQGLTMQTQIIIVQTAVPESEIGPATTTSSFIRQMGGVIGVAIFGVILTNTLSAGLKDVLGPIAYQYQLSAETLEAAVGYVTSGNAAAAMQLPGMTQEALQAIGAGYIEAFVRSFKWLFISLIPPNVIGAVASFFIKHIPLSKTLGTTAVGGH